jgi:hypothetical protein
MAEPNTPTGQPAENDRPEAAATPPESGLLAPPTEDELAETGEPTLEEIHAAAGDAEVIRPGERTGAHPVDTSAAQPADAAGTGPTESRPGERTGAHPVDTSSAEPADAAGTGPTESRPAARAVPVESVESAQADEPAAASSRADEPAAPARAEPQAVIPPAEESAPPAPKAHSNRLVATAWVLLAAGLFEVLYFASIALLELLIAGPNAVLPQVQALIDTKGAVFAWLPVLFFLLLFELTVLLLNRAGRFAYVVASAVVALLVYVISAILVPLVIAGAFADRSTALQAFLSPAFILILIVAREVMLWTGFAIGSRGTRVRRRNKEARARYDAELADADA